MTIKLWRYLAVGCFLVLLVKSCDMAYKDEVAEEAFYCQQVADGVWPAYKGKENCDD